MIERYKDKAIQELWNPAAVYRRWHEVEVAHLREVEGETAAEVLALIRPPSPAQVNYYERRTGHDVAGFLIGLDRNLQSARAKAIQRKESDELVFRIDKARQALHYGLTSSDVVDTGLALGLMRTQPAVKNRVANLQESLQAFIDQFTPGDTTIGRTHGQLAAPMPAEHRWGVLAEMLDRAWTRAECAFFVLDVGKMSGPVGVEGLDSTWEELALYRLGLRSTATTQIVPRDRLAHWAHCMAELATVFEAIATQVWLLAQSGIGEIRPAVTGTVGSSAMPHKRNPVLAENVRGLARMARSNAELLQLGVVQWGEHDLAHSSVERVAIPDLLHLVCTAATRTATLVAGMEWLDPGRPADYVDTHEELKMLQAVQGMPYVDAHGQLTRAYRDGTISGTTTTEETE